MAKRIDRFHNDFIDKDQLRNDREEVANPVNGEKDDNSGQNKEKAEGENSEKKKEDQEQTAVEYMKTGREEENDEGDDEDKDEDDEEDEAMDDEEEEEEEETEDEDADEEEEDMMGEEELEEEEEGERVDEPPSKRQKEMCPDRISDLPDEVILHILSLLDSEEIGRTSILSKRWKFLWASVPNLVFSDPNRQSDKFVQRVHKALFHHKSECLKKFAVCFQYRFYHAPDVDAWIHFVTENRVEDLILRLPRRYTGGINYHLPQHLFTNASLRNLELSFIKVLPSGTIIWTALKSLTLECLELTQVVLGKILSGSPFLEFLSISHFSGVHCFKINSRNLKEFVMQNHCGARLTQPVVEISAPNLLSMRVAGNLSRKIVQIRNVSSLVSADLGWYSLCWKGFAASDKVIREYMDGLFASLRHVTALKLGSWGIQVISALAFKGLPFVFPSNLKVLTLESSMPMETFPGFFEMLQSSPNLEILVIERPFASYPGTLLDFELFTGKKDEWTPKWRTPGCFLQHLRIVKIKSFMYPPDIDSSMLTLVGFLLQNADVLEQMVITEGPPFTCSCHRSPAFVELSQTLLNFPRSSPSVTFVFLP